MGLSREAARRPIATERSGRAQETEQQPDRPDTFGSQQPDRPDVFISYSREDKRFVQGELFAALEPRGKDVWIDLEDIPPAADWRERIWDGIEAARAFVFVLSSASLDSAICRQELRRAIDANKRLIPVLRREVDPDAVPDELERQNWILMRDGDDFDAAFERLVEALEVDLDWVDLHARLAVRAREWGRAGHDRSLLLRGSDLERAEAWLSEQASHAESPTPDQTSYILASRRAASRRQRLALFFVATALVVSLGLTAFALIQRNLAIDREKEARSKELATRATARLNTDPAQSFTLASQAVAAKQTPEAEDALRRSLFQSRLSAVLRGPDQIFASDMDRNGTRVITGYQDGTARVWDTRTGRALSTVREQRGFPVVAALSPDGRLAVTAATTIDARAPGAVHVREAATGRVVATLGGRSVSVFKMAFSPNGETVATGSRDGTVRVWDWAGNRAPVTLRRGSGVWDTSIRPGQDWVQALAFSGNGRFLAAGFTFSAGRVWEVATRRPILRLPAGVTALEFGGDGRTVLTGNWYGARLWRLPRARPAARFTHGSVQDVSLSPDGRLVLTAGPDGTVRIWDALSGDRRATLRHGDEVDEARFSADGRYVLSASADTTARVWDAQTGAPLATLRGHREPVSFAGFAPDPGRVVTASRDGTVRVWRIDDIVVFHGHKRAINDAQFVGDAKVVTASSDRTTSIWDAATGKRSAVLTRRDRRLPRRLRRHPLSVLNVAASPGGGRIAATEEDGTTTLWDVRRRMPVKLIDGDAYSRPAFTSDGRYLLTTDFRLHQRESPNVVVRIDSRDGKPAVVWRSANAADLLAASPAGPLFAVTTLGFVGSRAGAGVGTLQGRRLTRLRTGGAEVNDIAFSPGGRYVATAEGDTSAERGGSGAKDSGARVWDALKGGLVASFGRHEGPVLDMAFSPDGKRIVTASTDGTLRVWLTSSGRQLMVLRDENPISSPSFSPDGALVLAISGRRARVWDATTGTPVIDLPRHSGRITSAQFSPHGTAILTASDDGTARVHTCDACRPMEELLGDLRND